MLFALETNSLQCITYYFVKTVLFFNQVYVKNIQIQRKKQILIVFHSGHCYIIGP